MDYQKVHDKLDIDQRLQEIELKTMFEFAQLRLANQILTFNLVLIASALMLIMLVLMTTE